MRAEQIFVILLMLVSGYAVSHEPSEHETGGEKPDCAAMEDEGADKLDSSDPVMMAMMKKCMGQGSSQDDHAGTEGDNAGKQSESAAEGHGHDNHDRH